MESLKNTLGYDQSFAVSSSSHSGGLGLFWNNNTRVEILPYSQYHIDAIVTENRREPRRLKCVYEESQTAERHKTWEMLKFIKGSSHLPWVGIGNFNEVLHRDEHMGCKIGAMLKLQASVKWWMCVVCTTSVMRDESGLLKRE